MTEHDISNPIPRENNIDKQHNVNDYFFQDSLDEENKSLERRFYSSGVTISEDDTYRRG